MVVRIIAAPSPAVVIGVTPTPVSYTHLLSSLGHPDNDPYQPFRRADVGLWGGILAYQTGILDPMSDAQDNKQYTVANNLATGSRINPSMRNVNKGSIDEYSISGGFNIQNILYLGFTIGLQDLLYRNANYYACLLYTSRCV